MAQKKGPASFTKCCYVRRPAVVVGLFDDTDMSFRFRCLILQVT